MRSSTSKRSNQSARCSTAQHSTTQHNRKQTTTLNLVHHTRIPPVIYNERCVYDACSMCTFENMFHTTACPITHIFRGKICIASSFLSSRFERSTNPVSAPPRANPQKVSVKVQFYTPLVTSELHKFMFAYKILPDLPHALTNRIEHD